MDREQAVEQAEKAGQSRTAQEAVLKNMSNIARHDVELTAVERDFLFGAYNNVINSLQTSRKEASSTSQKQEFEQNLVDACGDILGLLRNPLINHAFSGGGKVLYRKIAGDINAYLAELAKSNAQPPQAHAKEAQNYYDEASGLARTELPSTHPIRLGLYLNYAVLYHDTLESPDKAINMAQTAFSEAIAKLDTLPEENYRASTRIMGQLNKKLQLWNPAASN